MNGINTSAEIFDDVSSTEDTEIQAQIGNYYNNLIDQMNGE